MNTVHGLAYISMYYAFIIIINRRYDSSNIRFLLIEHVIIPTLTT